MKENNTADFNASSLTRMHSNQLENGEKKMNKTTTTIITADRNGITKSIVSADTVKNTDRKQYKKFNRSFLFFLDYEADTFSTKYEVIMDALDKAVKLSETTEVITNIKDRVIRINKTYSDNSTMVNQVVSKKTTLHYYNKPIYTYNVVRFVTGEASPVIDEAKSRYEFAKFAGELAFFEDRRQQVRL